MPVNFSGITSGLDTKSIIDATIAAQRAPVTALNQRKSAWQTQISSLGKLSSKVDELKKLATDMKEIGKVLGTKSAISDEEVATATVDGAASAGHYDITVTQLAATEKDRSIGFAGDAEAVKAGKLTITTAGNAAVDIDIAENDSLADVVDKINASNARVDASIVRDGTKSYLQIVASDSGHAIGGVADDAITISESYTGTVGQELGLTQVVQAKNARLTVDTLAVEQRSNTVSEMLPGVKLELKKEAAVKLDVTANNDGTKDKVTKFVTLVNDVLKLVKDQTKTADGARQTQADPAIERLGRDVRALVGTTISGVTGRYNSLAGIGVKTNATGNFEIDTTALDKALTADSRAVGRIFTQPDTGLGARISAALESWTDPVDGIIGGRQKALNMRVKDADNQIVRMEDRLSRLQTTMQRQFTRMEQALSSFQLQAQSLAGLTSSSS